RCCVWRGPVGPTREPYQIPGVTGPPTRIGRTAGARQAVHLLPPLVCVPDTDPESSIMHSTRWNSILGAACGLALLALGAGVANAQVNPANFRSGIVTGTING